MSDPPPYKPIKRSCARCERQEIPVSFDLYFTGGVLLCGPCREKWLAQQAVEIG